MVSYLFTLLGGTCVVLGGFLLMLKSINNRIKKALVELVLSIGVLLIFDVLATYYNGMGGTKAYWMTRIGNLIVFLATSYVSIAINSYLICLFTEEVKSIKIPKRFWVAYLLPVISMVIICISQINGCMYYMDASNQYVRGPLFVLNYIIIYVTTMLQLSILIQYHTLLGRKAYFTSASFLILPMLGGVHQFLFPQYYMLYFAYGVTVLLAFATTLVEQNNHLVEAYYTEIVTGLPNSMGYIRELENRISGGNITMYDALYLDIKDMSRINKLYGKDNGDEVIKSFGVYLREHMVEDEVLGRLGGNYFVALIRKKNTDKFLKMLQAIPVEINMGDTKEIILISAIAGGYSIIDEQISADQILGKIAIAISIAKQSLNEKYVFLTPKLQSEFEKEKQMEYEITRSLKLGEFVPFYQPKVYAENKQLSGAEVLVRWNHNGEVISPNKFIPVMERNGSICQLDFYMLDRLCNDISEWLKKGIRPPKISVNFSRRNLGNPMMAEHIYETITKYNIPRELIEIEITETIDEFPLSALRDVVDKLREYGISVAIDDFGTGSSSIRLLCDINFDVLKIDKSFVDNILDSKRETELLRHVIAMANLYKVKIVVEGVEEEKQCDLLCELGCDEMQGVLFGCPLSREEFEARM